MDDRDRELHALAERQHGFVTRAQARAAGVGPRAAAHRLARGEWIADGRRLLRRAGTPWSKASPLMRAALDAGPRAVVSHSTAAAWWGLPGFDLRRIHVTRHRDVSGADVTFGQVLHRVLDIDEGQVTVLDGIPIVRPERMAFELCATVHPLRAARVIDTGWAKGLFSGTSLRRMHDALSDRGRKGTVVMREILEARPAGWVPPASGVEHKTMQILGDAGLGRFRRQVDLGDEVWVGRVDFLHETLPLVVEVQSERYHAALLDEQHDAERREALQRAGFVVVEVWDTDVWHHPATVVDAVRAGWHDARRSAA